jgi:hypothetical protein
MNIEEGDKSTTREKIVLARKNTFRPRINTREKSGTKLKKELAGIEIKESRMIDEELNKHLDQEGTKTSQQDLDSLYDSFIGTVMKKVKKTFKVTDFDQREKRQKT